MKTKTITQIALSALFAWGVALTPAFADITQPQKPAAAPSGPINWSALNLSPDQVKKINALRLDYNKQAIQLKANIQIKQLEIQKQLMAPAPNPSLVRQLLQDKLKLEGQIQSASLDHFLAIKKLLTPAQLAKLSEAVVIK
ncbi:MAG: periplasmic heavy metal sensor [Candidatus Sericytochromatia bacterium]|nr:periplasmic heavy metal sensor [Candidatus Sericytochromatia bacterium]